MPEAEKNEAAMNADQIKLHLKRAKKSPVHFAFGFAPEGPDKCVFKAAPRGQAKKLADELKKGDKNGELRKLCFGDMKMEGSTVTLHCLKPVPNFARLIDKHMRTLGVPKKNFQLVQEPVPAAT